MDSATLLPHAKFATSSCTPNVQSLDNHIGWDWNHIVDLAERYVVAKYF